MAYPKTPNFGGPPPPPAMPTKAPKAPPAPKAKGGPKNAAKPGQQAKGKQPNFRKKAPPPTSPPVRNPDSGASPNDRMAAQVTGRLRQRDQRLPWSKDPG